MRNLKKNIQPLIFTIVTWVMILTLVNGICGLIAGDKYVALDAANPAIHPEVLGYFAPHQKKTILFPGLKPYHVQTNRLGFRSVGDFDDWSVSQFQGYKKILALGDSVTFGLFVDDPDSYPYRLQKLFQEQKQSVAVFNAGIGSTTISDDYYYLKMKGIAFKPDLVVINFCDNDLIELQKWEQPMLTKMVEASQSSWDEKIKLANFVRVFRGLELNRRYQRMIKKNKDPKARHILLTESKNLDDIFYVTHDAYNPVLEDPQSLELQGQWQKYFEWLDQTAKLLNNEHIPFVVVIHPHIYSVFDKGRANYQDILIKHFKEQNIAYIDLKPEFQKHEQEIVGLYNNLPRDFHLSARGNQIMAQEVFRFANQLFYKI